VYARLYLLGRLPYQDDSEANRYPSSITASGIASIISTMTPRRPVELNGAISPQNGQRDHRRPIILPHAGQGAMRLWPV